LGGSALSCTAEQLVNACVANGSKVESDNGVDASDDDEEVEEEDDKDVMVEASKVCSNLCRNVPEFLVGNAFSYFAGLNGWTLYTLDPAQGRPSCKPTGFGPNSNLVYCWPELGNSGSRSGRQMYVLCSRFNKNGNPDHDGT